MLHASPRKQAATHTRAAVMLAKDCVWSQKVEQGIPAFLLDVYVRREKREGK